MAMANGGLKRKTVQITIPENDITRADGVTTLLKTLMPNAVVMLSCTLNGDPTTANQFVSYEYNDRFKVVVSRYRNGTLANFEWDYNAYDLRVVAGTIYTAEIITE